jgi:hypothetical protein
MNGEIGFEFGGSDFLEEAVYRIGNTQAIESL